MGRMVVVLLILVLVGAGLIGTLVPLVDCPDCPRMYPCIRCRNKEKITLLDSKRRPPVHPILARWLKNAVGATALYAAELAEANGRPRAEMLGWKENSEYFYYSNVTMVQGPDGSLALAVLKPKVQGREDDSGVRVLLFDRRGRELDRCDLSMPGVLSGLNVVLDGEFRSTVLVKLRIYEEPLEWIQIVSGPRKSLLPRKEWPSDWSTRGVVRIAAQEGRLEVIPP